MWLLYLHTLGDANDICVSFSYHSRLASECADSPANYHVLLIITDGVICDLEATKV